MLTVLRTHEIDVQGTAATTAQTLPVKIAHLQQTLVGGSAVGTVGASLEVKDATATSTATPHNPTDALTLSAAAVSDEIVKVVAVMPGDIPAWQ